MFCLDLVVAPVLHILDDRPFQDTKNNDRALIDGAVSRFDAEEPMRCIQGAHVFANLRL